MGDGPGNRATLPRARWRKSAFLAALAVLSSCGGGTRTPRNEPPADIKVPSEEHPVALLSPTLNVLLRAKTTCPAPCTNGSLTGNVEGLCVRYTSGVVGCADVLTRPVDARGLTVHELGHRTLWRDISHVASRASLACAVDARGGLRCATPDQPGSADPVFTRPTGRRVFLPDPRTACLLDREGSITCAGYPFEGKKPRPLEAVGKAFARAGRAREPVPDSRCVILDGGKLACLNPSGDAVTVIASDVAFASVRSGLGDFAGGCLVKRDGTAQCWGRNDVGELGTATRTPSETPMDVVDLANVAEISSSLDHACALTRDAAVFCWGSPDGYAFGEAALANARELRVCGEKELPEKDDCVRRRIAFQVTHSVPRPVRVDELSGVVSIATGPGLSCGLRRDGQIVCLGGGYPGAWSLEFGVHP